MKKYTILLLCIVMHCAQTMCMDAPVEKPIVTLFKAIKDRDNDKVKELVTAHPDIVNSYHACPSSSCFERVLFGEVTPLHVAVHVNYTTNVHFLLVSNADCNAATKGGQADTPLHLACSKEIAELLIENGALVEKRNEHGWTPLYAALFHPWRRLNKEVADCLIKDR